MKLWISLLATLVLGVFVAAALADQGDDEKEKKPKHSIKQVMGQAHKQKLRDKVLAEEASAEEKLKLLDLYVSLAENKPPTGEVDSWNEKTRAVVLAAAKVAVGREGALADLKTATTCGACHGPHKPK